MMGVLKDVFALALDIVGSLLHFLTVEILRISGKLTMYSKPAVLSQAKWKII